MNCSIKQQAPTRTSVLILDRRVGGSPGEVVVGGVGAVPGLVEDDLVVLVEALGIPEGSKLTVSR